MSLGSSREYEGQVKPSSIEKDMYVTITAQWASEDASNTISLYQGFMEYKN